MIESTPNLDVLATNKHEKARTVSCSFVFVRGWILLMIFRLIEPQDYEAVRRFLAENGWEKRVADKEKFQKMMKNADRAIAAFEGERVVGFARALCDDVSNGYIGTVAVAEDYRGRGIGRELVERLIGDDTNITWVLRAGRGSNEFWEKMGFTVSEIAMEKTRNL